MYVCMYKLVLFLREKSKYFKIKKFASDFHFVVNLFF